VKRLSLILALALLFVGCAGNTKLNTVITLVPKIQQGVVNFQNSLDQNKVALQAMTCGVDDANPPQPRNCYVALNVWAGRMSGWNTMLADAASALNTTSARQTIVLMIGSVEDWINNQLIKLPQNMQTWLLVGMEAVRTTLLVMQASLPVGG
jgi:hypothetical protein